MKTQLKGSVLLLLTALIWGSAFVAQSVGMDYVGPFTFNSVRCIIGGIVLLPCIALLDKMNGRKISVWGTNENAARKTLVTGGVLCGVLLAIASSFQQMGIRSEEHTSELQSLTTYLVCRLLLEKNLFL